MKNAFNEFKSHIKERKVKCCIIYDDDKYCYETKEYIHPIRAILKNGYTEEDLDKFKNDLNFTYDCGYGGQNLFGIIWYTDGTWSERGEYEGSEWWEHKKLPDLPEELKNP